MVLHGMMTRPSGSHRDQVVEASIDLADRPELMAAIEEEVTIDHFGEMIHKQMFAAIAQAPQVAGQPVSMKTLMDAAGGDPLMPVIEGYTLAIYVARLIAEAPMAPDARFAGATRL